MRTVVLVCALLIGKRVEDDTNKRIRQRRSP